MTDNPSSKRRSESPTSLDNAVSLPTCTVVIDTVVNVHKLFRQLRKVRLSRKFKKIRWSMQFRKVRLHGQFRKVRLSINF